MGVGSNSLPFSNLRESANDGFITAQWQTPAARYAASTWAASPPCSKPDFSALFHNAVCATRIIVKIAGEAVWRIVFARPARWFSGCRRVDNRKRLVQIFALFYNSVNSIPSFPRKRESNSLPFSNLRESANDDLSPQMANPCGGYAASNLGGFAAML